jgi:DNA helicase II / ATP-dependent DNA helicase PcrA
MSEMTAGGIAARLGAHPPTPEQAAIIESGPDPMLVIAGAGSGKTSTMADRVVWLIANGKVRPEHVLGLTFTRKAAAELAARIRTKLARLAEHVEGIAELHGEPTVSTYNAYAAGLVSEHGIRIGVEPGTRVVTETGSWQLARDLVTGWDGEMTEFDTGVDDVTEKTLRLAGELAEHLRGGDDLRRFDEELAEALEARQGKRTNEDFRKLASVVRRHDQLLPLVEAWERRKREHRVMDFADQLSMAAALAESSPEIVAAERDRWRVVLLDEYQDTSHSQVTLLRRLFGDGHPVTAVGDPNQSIYSWRGASAGTLQRFPADFPNRGGEGADVAYLTVSWRNREEILDVANEVSGPLRAGTVPPLDAGVGGRGQVEAAMHETVYDEAQWVAERVAAHWDRDEQETAAVLVRKRRQIPALHRAMTAAGLPVQVVGALGLLYYPEVAEVVAMLRAAADPLDGPALMRLLTGTRWRIGPRDVDALWRRARAPAPESRGFEPEAGAEAEALLADALADPGEAERYSPLAALRFERLHEELTWIRGRLNQSLPDLVGDVITKSGLDVEVMLHQGDLSNLDEFTDVAATYESGAGNASVTGFLSYLESAAERERGLSVEGAEPVGGVVQLMTIHAAKGLEWDVVAVPGLCEGVLPSGGRGSTWVTDPSRLPYPLRGDAGNLAVLDLAGTVDAAGVKRALLAFKRDDKEARLDEERRLAYVALTRAKRALLASGYWWDAESGQPHPPAPYLEEARQAGAAVAVWAAQSASNPLEDQAPTAQWPKRDPLGSRQEVFAAAAEAVVASDGTLGDSDEERAWLEEAALLLAERAERESGTVVLRRPEQLSASRLMALRADEAGFAARMRRPMPQPPQEAARRGTDFHAWVEEFFGGGALFDPDELPGAADAVLGEAELESLQSAFRESSWAGRSVVAQEVPFVVEFDGAVVRGRIDAVFARDDGGYDIVDWKTGRPPKGEAARHAALQLAVYRKAWARLKGVEEDQIRVAFHYVGGDETVWPDLDGVES